MKLMTKSELLAEVDWDLIKSPPAGDGWDIGVLRNLFGENTVIAEWIQDSYDGGVAVMVYWFGDNTAVLIADDYVTWREVSQWETEGLSGEELRSQVQDIIDRSKVFASARECLDFCEKVDSLPDTPYQNRRFKFAYNLVNPLNKLLNKVPRN